MFFIIKSVYIFVYNLKKRLSPIFIRLLFRANGVKLSTVSGIGIPRIEIRRKSTCSIGDNFIINSYGYSGLTGENRPTKILVAENAKLIIGNNVGMSSTLIACYEHIEIKDYVKIGGGVMIMDTDFHSLDPSVRKTNEDSKYAMKKPIEIGENVFIGTASIILKGVSIGKNSIVGAGSVVAKSIPENEIWAGNPAKFIKKIQ